MKYLVILCFLITSQLVRASDFLVLESKYNFNKTIETIKSKILDKKFKIFK